MAQKPSIPKGTRDFGPEQMVRRNFIFSSIKSTFQKFGFLPLETPSFEKTEVLTGKYGDEGDNLMFRILKSGNYLSKASPLPQESELFKNDISRVGDDDRSQLGTLTKAISEKALRYDLTVPFARYVVMNQSEIAFPFKRYQIQPVWRADRPQRGRYQEFYQCDADIVGTDSLICEADIVLMINEVLSKLSIEKYAIKMNNRKILSGIAQLLDASDKESDLFVAIDKLDKIGIDKVNEELAGKGFADKAIQQLNTILQLEGTISSKLDTLKEMFAASPTGLQGIKELRTVFHYIKTYGLADHHVDFDVTLARGLSYYTGAIFEVKAFDTTIGSISGGGRYDNLTGVFGLDNVSGVGFSFGVDRIYDVMEELELFPTIVGTTTQALFINFDEQTEAYCLPLLTKLRAEGINSEIFPDSAKMKKQMTYANRKAIPYVILAGSDEMSSGKLTFKDMESGAQESLTIDDIIAKIKA